MNFGCKKFIVSFICFILIILFTGQTLVFASPPDNINLDSQNIHQSSRLPKVPKLGGSYKRLVTQNYNHNTFEVHHIITRSALNFLSFFCKMIIGKNDDNSFLFSKKQNWAPSIILTHDDHALIPSSGGSSSVMYNMAQALRIIFTGDFATSIENEISFIEHNLNGNHKYDSAIRQLREYVRSLHIHIEGSNIVLTLNGEKKYIPLLPQDTTDLPKLM